MVMEHNSKECEGVAARFSIMELYCRNWDFARYTHSSRVEYMLAALPRSGSTYLALEMWRTGVLGAPLEYANPPFRDCLHHRLDAANELRSYWPALKHVRTSPNGVFGFKMFQSDYMDFALKHQEILTSITPDKVIFLTRENTIAQAVSYSKAIRSGRWLEGEKCLQNALYDAGHIRWCLAMLNYQADFWDELFALTGTKPHRVTYEALVGDRDEAIREIADFLGVTLDRNARVELPVPQIQRNAESAEWIRRFGDEPPEGSGDALIPPLTFSTDST